MQIQKKYSNQELILCISSVLMSAFCFVFYLIRPNSYPLLYITLGMIFMWCAKNPKIHIDNETLLWLLSAIIILVSSALSNDSAALKYGLTLFSFVFIMVVLKGANNDWKKWFSISVGVFSTVHVIATVLQFLNPEWIDSINRVVLPNISYSENSRLLKHLGAYAGVTGQTGRNGLYISVALGFWIVSLMTTSNKKKRVVSFGMIVLSFGALLLTHKRMFIVIPLINILILLMMRKKIRAKNVVHILFTAVLGSIIFSLAIRNIPELAFTFQRFSSDDISTGRYDLWKQGINTVAEHPFWGVGILNSRNIIGMWPHNIYIQLLAEVGVVGGVIVICSMVYSIVKKIRISKYINETNKKFHYLCIYFQLLFLIYGFTGNPFFEIQVVGFYITTLALGCSKYNSCMEYNKY